MKSWVVIFSVGFLMCTSGFSQEWEEARSRVATNLSSDIIDGLKEVDFNSLDLRENQVKNIVSDAFYNSLAKNLSDERVKTAITRDAKLIGELDEFSNDWSGLKKKHKLEVKKRLYDSYCKFLDEVLEVMLNSNLSTKTYIGFYEINLNASMGDKNLLYMERVFSNLQKKTQDTRSNLNSRTIRRMQGKMEMVFRVLKASADDINLEKVLKVIF